MLQITKLLKLYANHTKTGIELQKFGTEIEVFTIR